MNADVTLAVFIITLPAIMADEATRKAVQEIPLLKTNSGPRDKELWVQRLREEYIALIKVSLAVIHSQIIPTSHVVVVLANWLV